jgi:UDP-glucose 4-epimerase
LEQNRKILVTGGTGFIGSHVVKNLIELGYNPVVIDNLSNSTEQILVKYFSNKSDNKVIFYNVDINDKNTIEHIFGHEKIVGCIHLAAKISVSESISKPAQTMNTNVAGTRNILEVCSNHKVEDFVFASSAAVYGDNQALPVSEDSPLNPLSPYGVSKVEAERIVSSHNKSKIANAISLRFFNVYGRGQTIEYAGVITRFAERLRKNMPPIIYGDGTQTRDFIAVRDIVNAILLVIGIGKERRKINIPQCAYNVGTGRPTTIRDLANMMIKASGLDLQPIFAKPINGEIKHSYADITRIKEDFGFADSEDIKSSISEMLEV